MNGIQTEYSTDELVMVGHSVADGTMKYEPLLEWVKCHMVP